ncbi:uncharacterized protein F4807DRAFT_456570 [Annulohypoxylon truncatum]|uniref:uncharacterized protein n=1 Tax=Annulohypoxylon truncatum TaxID=327061 RepID=UPI002008C6D1|nr:uncharacterized protein F4807DRAFT_456570 [Annulohypoxylon truncatum]KAI1213229.1 hypothetical protein F4807DRAFT_456570 [Annulohypoxylon truncatum]
MEHARSSIPFGEGSRATLNDTARAVTGGLSSRLQMMNIGEVSKKGMEFCAWKAIRAFPYAYGNKQNQELVGETFNLVLFKNRSWDAYYLSDPSGLGRDPLLLVPTSQFKDFLNVVSNQLNLPLSIPRGQAGEKFSLAFGNWGLPLPHFLGRARSLDDLERLKNQAKGLPKDDLTGLNASALEVFKNKMEEIHNSIKSGKKKKNPEATRIKRIERQKGYGRMIKRSQRYLGLLRGRNEFGFGFNPGASMATWDVDKPVPFQTKDSVRFVCVDVEAWERSRHVITEVGFAVLDTEDTRRIPPGKDGCNWFELIKSRHFVIREHMDKINSTYVQGCPQLFGFGVSEYVYSRDIARMIGTIIGDTESEDKRPVIMVGHDMAQDLNYLTKVGFNVWRVPHFTDEIDTKSMFQRLRKTANGRGLSTVCEELGIPGYNFHNAGNDATYTLRAMIAMAVQQAAKDFSRQGYNNAIEPGDDEWSDGALDDGGQPQVSSEPVPNTAHLPPRAQGEW